jgi:hypothetical protein
VENTQALAKTSSKEEPETKMPKKISHLKDLSPDPKNPRRHTERGMGLLEKTLEKLGAGRSILVDESGRILAGHGVVEAAGNVGIEKVIPVEASGHELIAVVRKGLREKQKQEMALADNRISDLSGYDPGSLKSLGDVVDLSKFFTEREIQGLIKEAHEIPKPKYPEMEIQPFEHYDYILLFFRHSMDFLKACERFGLKKVRFESGGKKGPNVGLGRVLDGAAFLKRVCKSKS